MPLKSVLPAAEMFFAVYFSYFVWYAIEHRQFLSVPFLLMFNLGFFTSHFARSYNGYRNSIGTTAGPLTRCPLRRTYVSPSLVHANCCGCAGSYPIARAVSPAKRDRQC